MDLSKLPPHLRSRLTRPPQDVAAFEADAQAFAQLLDLARQSETSAEFHFMLKSAAALRLVPIETIHKMILNQTTITLGGDGLPTFTVNTAPLYAKAMLLGAYKNVRYK